VLNGEVTNTNVIVFDLNRPDLELVISHTRSKHVNRYTVDAVCFGDVVGNRD